MNITNLNVQGMTGSAYKSGVPGITFQNVQKQNKEIVQNPNAREVKRMVSQTKRDANKKSVQMVSQNSVLDSLKKAGETLRNQRKQDKNTALSLKTLKYHFKDISSKIIRSKTSASARMVAAQAKREVQRLKKERQNGQYNSDEIEAAIAHAKAMERVAKKKVKHLEEEEMAKAAAGPCADLKINEEEQDLQENQLKQTDETGGAEEDVYEQQEDVYDQSEIFREPEMNSESLLPEESLSDLVSQFEEAVFEMMDQFSQAMSDMLEEMGMDELSDSLMATRDDMDPEDLKAMKIKHRNKEMKEIVKADADYLKAVFEQYEKTKAGGMNAIDYASQDAGTAGIMPSFSVEAPTINIAL